MRFERQVEVRWRFIGFHRWPEATGARAYLADRHRHEFHCAVRLDVDHNDREVEFHDLSDACRSLFEHGEELGRQSCEDIAVSIQAAVEATFDRRLMTVEVFEDGEAGAVLTWTR